MSCSQRLVMTPEYVYDYTCDVCGGPCPEPERCRICSRHLCLLHVEERVYHEGGDCCDVYCKSCWDIGEKSRAGLAALEKEHDARKEALNEEWKSAALAKVESGVRSATERGVECAGVQEELS